MLSFESPFDHNKLSKTFLFQAIQFSQKVLIQTIQFSISTQFKCKYSLIALGISATDELALV